MPGASNPAGDAAPPALAPIEPLLGGGVEGGSPEDLGRALGDGEDGPCAE